MEYTSDDSTDRLEKKKIVRNFRESPEVEKFYRFVMENDLRHEAYLIFERVLSLKKKKKKNKVYH